MGEEFTRQATDWQEWGWLFIFGPIPAWDSTFAVFTSLSPAIPQATATGRDGMLKLLAKGVQASHYTALCLPDDLEARGVADLPNYYYKEDGMKIWTAIEKWALGTAGKKEELGLDSVLKWKVVCICIWMQNPYQNP